MFLFLNLNILSCRFDPLTLTLPKYFNSIFCFFFAFYSYSFFSIYYLSSYSYYFSSSFLDSGSSSLSYFYCLYLFYSYPFFFFLFLITEIIYYLSWKKSLSSDYCSLKGFRPLLSFISLSIFIFSIFFLI